MTSFLTLNQTAHEVTPPYSPQSNPIERVNRNIKTMIRSYLSDKHNKWDEWLPELTYAYNTSLHSSPACSPTFFNFGRDPRYLELHRNLTLIPETPVLEEREY